ncbi:hypothetical protein SAMN02910340_02700 [Methanosarcina thermophila]|jgi:hypothetical protein|uniref:Uncharacterized protein n=1 Tax=Methanosarcina thermophila TaxID=2210 RepID=A0A1I7BBZ1_METTE|nr:hypothetical protein SAMN02910340_02700 [Methanosarcina thermophila]
MNVIVYYFHCIYFVAIFSANVTENQLAILFNSLIIEYTVSTVSIVRHQYDVVSNLTIAMAKTA